MSFIDFHRELGIPSNISVVLSDDAARYSLTFNRGMRNHNLDAIREFVSVHEAIERVEQDADDLRGAIVVCKHDDQDYGVLKWLHAQFEPHRSLTAVAQLFTAVQPMVARLEIIGAPATFEAIDSITNEFERQGDVWCARYARRARQIVVIFRRGTNEEYARLILKTQSRFGATVTTDDKKKPMIPFNFTAEPE